MSKLPANPWLVARSGDGVAVAFAGRQLLTLLAAGTVVQLLIPYRYDNPAHVVAGGAMVLLVGSALNPGTLSKLGVLTELALFSAVLAVAWFSEMAIFGPFDLIDVAFTLGGAFVSLAALSDLAAVDRDDRRAVLATSAVLMAGSLGYRYLMGIGPS